MIVDRVDPSTVELKPYKAVKVTEQGCITEVMYLEHVNRKQTTLKIDKDTYVNLETGELRGINHGSSRADGVKSLRKTFRRLRALINTNCSDTERVRWCTLTYAECMTDTERLYMDYKAFYKRLLRYCNRKGYGKPEYIVVIEPQARGAWHMHLLLIWEQVAPYIPNKDLRELWGHGYVSIKALDGCDNVGAYLTAYLADMELTESEPYTVGEVKDVLSEGAPKRIVKGGRLPLYPVGVNIYRTSRGIRQPTESWMSQDEATQKVSEATETFASAVQLYDTEGADDGQVLKPLNTIVKTYYNSKCHALQQF